MILVSRSRVRHEPGIRKASSTFTAEAFERATRRVEHQVLAPLCATRLGEWLADVGRALRELEALWSQWLTGSTDDAAPISSEHPARPAAWRRLHELQAVSDEIEALHRRLDDPSDTVAVLDHAWTLRDVAVFTSVELRMFYDTFTPPLGAVPA